MRTTLVIHVPGLSAQVAHKLRHSPSLAPHLSRYTTRELAPTFPAVTCTVQANLTTGTTPDTHGIIANGLPTYLSPADQSETDPANHVAHRRTVTFWEQANTLLHAPRFWEKAHTRTALLFFQQSMPGWGPNPKQAADLVITPKPEHGPDGRLKSLLWSNHPEVLATLQSALGPFPLHHYWGPLASLPSIIFIGKMGMVAFP